MTRRELPALDFAMTSMARQALRRRPAVAALIDHCNTVLESEIVHAGELVQAGGPPSVGAEGLEKFLSAASDRSELLRSLDRVAEGSRAHRPVAEAQLARIEAKIEAKVASRNAARAGAVAQGVP